MSKKNSPDLGKKAFRKLKETAVLYKLIHKYKLRETAYKTVLRLYIKQQQKG